MPYLASGHGVHLALRHAIAALHFEQAPLFLCELETLGTAPRSTALAPRQGIDLLLEGRLALRRGLLLPFALFLELLLKGHVTQLYGTHEICLALDIVERKFTFERRVAVRLFFRKQHSLPREVAVGRIVQTIMHKIARKHAHRLWPCRVLLQLGRGHEWKLLELLVGKLLKDIVIVLHAVLLGITKKHRRTGHSTHTRHQCPAHAC